MKNRTNIPDYLEQLRELYEGTPGPGEQEGSDELESMRRIKALLDARPSRRPDREAVSAVLAAARGEAVPRGRRVDREPAARHRAVGLRVGAISAVLTALLVVITVGDLDRTGPEPASSPPPTETNAAPSMDAESGDESVETLAQRREVGAAPARRETAPERAEGRLALREYAGRPDLTDDLGPASLSNGAAARRALRQMQALGLDPSAAAPPMDAVVTDEDVLSWDQRDDVMEVYQQIRILGGGVEVSWGRSAVPLEMLPADVAPTSRGVQPAGDRRTP